MAGMQRQRHIAAVYRRCCAHVPACMGWVSSPRNIRMGVVLCRRLSLPVVLGGTVHSVFPRMYGNNTIHKKSDADKISQAKWKILFGESCRSKQ